jgi:ABC-type phosphate transport system substrate-binding protein
MSLSSRFRVNVFGLALALSSGAAVADVVAVVSAKSAIASLNSGQMADIFLGRMSHFPGGALAVPIDLREGSPERDEFYLTIAGRSSAQIKAYWSKIIFTGRGQPPRTVANSLEMIKVIASNPAAIGYIDASLLDDSVRALR